MKEWENQMGALEKATEMSEIDYLVETNIVLHDYEHPDSLTNHVSDVLTKLREVRIVENNRGFGMAKMAAMPKWSIEFPLSNGPFWHRGLQHDLEWLYPNGGNAKMAHFGR